MEFSRHEQYMQRCIRLAKLGAGATGSNPMVGAVLVCGDRVIGEGYHMRYGEAHAEVNCINSVLPEDQHLVSFSTIYVSLEPCAHFGKTPPCADLIISRNIPRVVIGCRDPFPAVNGKGIEKLEAAGVEVTLGVLQDECLALNKRFFTFHTKYRPFVILKWAQTADGIIGKKNVPGANPETGNVNPVAERLLISNEFSNRLVHQWRSGEAAIMIGRNTAISDDPSLTTRLWPGKNPVRIVTAKNPDLPSTLKILDHSVPTIVFNSARDHSYEHLEYIRIEQMTSPDRAPAIKAMMDALYMRNITSVLIEGGQKLLQSFIDCGTWDEARVITNEILYYQGDNRHAVPSPKLSNANLTGSVKLENDSISFFINNNQRQS